MKAVQPMNVRSVAVRPAPQEQEDKVLHEHRH